MRAWRRLYAELAYLFEWAWLEGRMVALTPAQARARLAGLEARRSARLGR